MTRWICEAIAQGNNRKTVVHIWKSARAFAIARSRFGYKSLIFISNDIETGQALSLVDFLIPQGEVWLSLLETDYSNKAKFPSLDSKQKLLQYWQDGLTIPNKFWYILHETIFSVWENANKQDAKVPGCSRSCRPTSMTSSWLKMRLFSTAFGKSEKPSRLLKVEMKRFEMQKSNSQTK